jgi:hypothetical protein
MANLLGSLDGTSPVLKGAGGRPELECYEGL